MKEPRQRLLVSVRGKNEALAAVRGGAHIADVEYPVSALGTPYPLNVHAVRRALPKRIAVSTNIGEEQRGRSTACQAALGIALAGADIIKVGLARMSAREAKEFGPTVVRTIKKWFPRKQVIPVLFADPHLADWYIDPIRHGPRLAAEMKADGLLIDTYDKTLGFGLLDYYDMRQIRLFVRKCHDLGIEAWLAGSINAEQLPNLWGAGTDVICVRGAACTSGRGRFGTVAPGVVGTLISTIPVQLVKQP